MTPMKTSSVSAATCMALAIAAALVTAPVSAPAADAAARVSTFASGAQGWQGPTGPGGATAVDATIGKPAPALHTRFSDFGITFRHRLEAAAFGRRLAEGPVAIGLDTNAFSVFFFSREVTRDLAVEIRDYDNPPQGYPYTSVYKVIGTLDSSRPGWRRFSTVIPNPRSEALPDGWGGYGAEDPVTFEPILPPGRTFADVLANADEIAFTTLVPGFFFGETFFDVAIDNVFIAVPPR